MANVMRFIAGGDDNGYFGYWYNSTPRYNITGKGFKHKSIIQDKEGVNKKHPTSKYQKSMHPK